MQGELNTTNGTLINHFQSIKIAELHTKQSTSFQLSNIIMFENLSSDTTDFLRSCLQVIALNIPRPIRDYGVSVIGETCYKSLLELDMESAECLKLAISKGLGIGIIAASTVVKIPQIIKLIKSRSASGLSFLSYVLETLSYLISLAYSIKNDFPLSAFGETAMILLQDIIIALLILHYSGKTLLAATYIAGLASSVYILFESPVLDSKVFRYLQATAGTLGAASKLPQILAIWREGGTGQLSAFAVLNYLAGSLARVFTTFQEIDDKLVLYGYIAGLSLNTLIAIQMIYYWNYPDQRSRSKKETISAPNSSTPKSTLKGRGSSSRRRG